MLKCLLVFLISVVLSLLITPFSKWLAFKLVFLDNPGARKIHNMPIPLMGGPVIFISLVLALMFFQNFSKEIISIYAFGLVYIIFGLLDDKGIKIRARNKIFSHLLFSLAFVYFSGLHLAFFRFEWINILITAGFITFMTNSMNMLDGMDGLVSGISFIASAFFAILAFNSGQKDIMMICFALMGATLGFLKYNFNPASIFLGEAGSTFLGFILAVISIKLNILTLWNVALSLGVERLQIISFVVPLIILGIPIFDTYFVFTNRFLNKIKFSKPGKDHSHHRIHLMGFSQKATVLTLYAIQVVLGSIALAMIRSDLQQFFALILIVGVFFVCFTIFLTRVKVYS